MKTIRTSRAHPIRVDFLPTGLPGRVGLTLAPGKHQSSKSGPPWARDLEADLDRLVEAYDTRLLVCLLEDHELRRLKIPNLVAEAEGRGLAVLRLPIPDGGVLPAADRAAAVVEQIQAAAAAGETVVVHCAGGLGRAGTIGGCLLVARGMTPAEAIDALHTHRSPNSPETRAQEGFIAAFAERRRAPCTLEGRADQVAGAVLGAAIGDAMGHPTEFMDMASIRAAYGPEGVQGFELFRDDAGGKYAPYTDDTQMAEAVARGLLDAGVDDLDATIRAIAARFVGWAAHPQGGHRAPGNACLSGCRALAAGAHWAEAGGPTAGGCGSVMRAYPFGLVFADDLAKAEDWAVAHSALTHRDPIARAACAAMAVGVARALRRDPVDTITCEMVAAAGRHCPRTQAMMAQALDEARAGVGPEVTLDRLRGWAAHEAIAAAVYIFARHADDPRAAILEGANTPGDSDSLATLAGALTGARGGLRALPEEWVRDVERSSALLALADSLCSLQ